MSGRDAKVTAERRKYRADLTSWADEIKNAPSARAALRAAFNQPVAGQLLRSVTSDYLADKDALMQIIEKTLEARVATVHGKEEQMACASIAIRLTWARSVVKWANGVKRSNVSIFA